MPATPSTPIVFRPSSSLPASSSSSSSLIEIYARWDHANSTGSSRNTNPPQILVGVSRAIHPWESSVELLVPSMTTTTIQMFPDSIRFRFSCTAGRNGSFYICWETRNVLFRILSIEGEERLRKERNGLMLRWKIKLCKSFFLKSYELSRNRRIESSWNGEKLYTSFLICRSIFLKGSFLRVFLIRPITFPVVDFKL